MTKNRLESDMEVAWFKPFGWLYRPVATAGWIAVLLATTFCVLVFAAMDRHSRSAGDTLFGIFPYLVSAFLLIDWIASKVSAPRRSLENRVERR